MGVKPFQVESAFSNYLCLKFLLSILFPFVVTMINLRRTIDRTDIQLAWLSFLIGAAQMYLLAEGGERIYHGNFRWGAQVTLFLLFALHGRYFARNIHVYKSLPKREAVIIYMTYMAHLLAGFVYYMYTFISADYG